MIELLKPRIRVIAPAPFIKNKVGDYLERIETEEGFLFGIDKEKERAFYPEKTFEEWPHIFCSSKWWEDRDDMPEYVKWNSCNSGRQYVVKILEIKEDTFRWEGGWETFTEGQDFPATKEEYNKYLKTKQQ